MITFIYEYHIVGFHKLLGAKDGYFEGEMGEN